jgi:hypothetical protein
MQDGADLLEVESAEAGAAEEFARHQALASAKRLALSRQLVDLQKPAPIAPCPGHKTPGLYPNISLAVHPPALLPPHLLNLTTPSPPTTLSSSTTRAAYAAHGFAAPSNDVPLIGTPRPGEASQE